MPKHKAKSVYTVVEAKKFILPANLLPKVFDFAGGSVKFIKRAYAETLLEVFSKSFAIGVYAAKKNESRTATVRVEFICCQSSCHKQFKIECEKKNIVVGNDLEWIVSSEEKQCVHGIEEAKSRLITGEKRSQLKEKLSKQAPTTVYRELVESENFNDVNKGVSGKQKYFLFCFSLIICSFSCHK